MAPPASANRDDGLDKCRVIRDLADLVESGRQFPTIYADPPWAYRNESSRAAAKNHYATLSLKQICDLPVSDLADENAHLHLWVTTLLSGR